AWKPIFGIEKRKAEVSGFRFEGKPQSDQCLNHGIDGYPKTVPRWRWA
ncbi:unnamed protein product, partial [Allacma fusca]